MTQEIQARRSWLLSISRRQRTHRSPGTPEFAALAKLALDVVPEAVFIARPNGRVLGLNRMARALLEWKPGVRLLPGRHRVRLETSAEVIRRIAAITEGGPEPEPLIVHRSSGPSLRIHVRKLDVEDGEVCAAVIVETLSARPALDAEQIAERFGLTPAEGRVAAMLARGLDVRGAARELGCAAQTVRGHLKQVFVKTNTHRQAALVVKLLGS